MSLGCRRPRHWHTNERCTIAKTRAHGRVERRAVQDYSLERGQLGAVLDVVERGALRGQLARDARVLGVLRQQHQLRVVAHVLQVVQRLERNYVWLRVLRVCKLHAGTGR